MFNWIKQQAKNAFSWVNNNIVKPVTKAVTPVYNNVKNTVNNVVRTVTSSVNKTGTTYRPPTTTAPKPSAPQGPTQAQINQQTVNATANKLKGWLTSYNAKAQASTPSWGKPLSPDYSAQSKARAAEIRKGWGKSISSGWNKLSNWAGNTTAGKWADDTFFRPGREINQKNDDAERLDREAEINAKLWEKRTTKIEAEIDQRLRDRDSGKISPEEYNAWATATDEKWTKAAQKDIQWFADKQKEIMMPVVLNKSSQWLAKTGTAIAKNPISKFFGNVAKYSIGGGDQSVPSLATAPKRLLLTARNWWEQKQADEATKNGYRSAKDLGNGVWGADNKVNISQKFYDGDAPKNPKNIWESTWNQRSNPDNKYMGIEGDKAKERMNWLSEFVQDPAWFIPAGSGEKIGSKFLNTIGKSSTVRSLSAIWKADDQPIAKAIKWLGADALSASEKLNKSLGKLSKGKKYDDLPYDQQKLVRDLVGSGVDLRGKNVDAILDIVKSKQKMYQSFLKTERAKGLNVTERKGYFGKVTSGNLGKQNLGEKELYDQRFWRSKGDSILTTKKAFADAEATRTYLHLKATGQLLEGHNQQQILKELYDQALKSVKGLSDKDIQEVQRLMLNRKLSTTLGRSFGSGARSANLRKYMEPTIKRAGGDIAATKIIHRLKNGQVIPWRGGPISPNQLWKKSVLQARPSWYINNASWNLPASFMAGGVGTARSYAKLGVRAIKERTLSPKIIERMPKEVVGNGLYNEFGKAGKRVLGEKVENFSRAAAYDAMIRKGMKPADATKRVNKYLFDYKTTKNWERPLKSVFPFWNWSKNITRLTAQMPLDNAKATKIFREIRTQLMDKPLSEIPDEDLSFTDPESGQVINYNPRDGYKGKIKIPGKGWRTIPFLPIQPEQLSEIGLSPWIRLSNEYFTGKDAYGKSFLGEDSVGSRIGKAFPQVALKQSFDKMMDQKTGKNRGDKFWISESGYSKFKQGVDDSKTNYDPNLDKTKRYVKDVQNFALAGWGNYKEDFDPKKFKSTQDYRAFSKEYFSHDWAKEYPTGADFEKKQAAQKEIASKYGLDLEKDIYKKAWRKYDTPDTLAKKDAKEGMIAKRKEIYEEYGNLPKGTGERTAFIKKYKDMVANDPEFLKKYPNMDLFPNTPVGNLNPRGKTSVQYNGKWFKTAASRDKYIAYQTNKPFWDKYWASTSAKVRRDMLRARPDLAKKKTMVLDPNSPNPKVRMAWAYEKLDPIARKKYFKEQGFVYSGPSISFAEQDQISKEAKAYDLSVNPELRTFQSEYAKKIQSTVRGKRVKTGKKIVWGTKKLDKVSWKA